jgi:hypothetical protein
LLAFVVATIIGPILLLSWTLIYPLSCWVLLIPFLITILLTLAAREQLRHRRQCIADCFFVEGSLLHRFLRGTSLITLTSFVVSAVLTTALLSTAVGWGFPVLALLTVDALLIPLLYLGFYGTATSMLRVNAAYRHLFAQRWAVTTNLLLLVPTLLFIQLQQQPPAWIDGSLNLSATLHAASDSVGSACPIVDSLVRLNQEKDALSWWLIIKGTRGTDDNLIRWVAWLLFLLSGTLSVLAFSRLCVYLVYIAHRIRAGDNNKQDQALRRLTPEKLFKIVFWDTILIIAILYIYANIQVAKITIDDEGKVLVSEAFYQDWKQALPELFKDMDVALDTTVDQFEQQVSLHIDAAFLPVYQQVPTYLDFHYSIPGEYIELFAGLSGGLGENLQRILFTESGFDEHMNTSMTAIISQGDTLLGELLTQYNERLQQIFDLEYSELALLSNVVTLSVNDTNKRFDGIDLLVKSSGAAIGLVIAKTIGTKLSAKIVTKIATKIASKTAIKAGGASSGAAAGGAAGLLCGPAAWFCSPVAAVGTAAVFWFGTDQVILKIDEYLNRDKLEDQINTAITDEKILYKQQVVQLYKDHLQKILEDNETRLDDITTKELIEGL